MSENLHIVLFGAPAAGKSALIGALAEAAQQQGAELGGHLLDKGGGMAEIRKQIYDKGPPPTQEELHDYPLAVEPLAPGKGGNVSATLTDCSGAAAKAILARETFPANDRLAKTLLAADAVVIPVDATTWERDVPRITEFLRLFQGVRGERTDITGLPVYVVLSKCDAIAKPGDSYKQWVQRIEETKRKLDDRLQATLKEQAELPFGRVDLHLWATAVKRPALTDRAAKAEPFGVAELFRQGLVSAREFRTDHEHAAGRLSLTVAGMFGLVATLGVVTATLYFQRPSAELTALENQARRVLSGSLTERFRDPVEDRVKELQLLEESPQFPNLSTKLQQDIEAARRETAWYFAVQKDFAAQVTQPRLATRDEDLDRIEKGLAAFELPEEYRASWTETKLARRVKQWRYDIQQLREAEKDEIAWMELQVKQATELRKQGGRVVAEEVTPAQREEWLKQVQKYLEREPRHKRNERIAKDSSLYYDVVYRMQRVEQARKAWDDAKTRLRNQRKDVPMG